MSFETEALSKIKIYYQYEKVEWLKKFFDCLNELINELFIDFVKNNFIPAINIQKSEELYLSYYVQYVFGLFRPLGASSVNAFYDIGEKYDSLTANNNPIIYDDSEEYDGRISMGDFIILLRFILDYSQEVINQPMIIDLVCKMCDIEPNEIKISFPDVETIKFTLPNTQKTSDFVKLVLNYYDWLGLPFGVNIDFAIQD